MLVENCIVRELGQYDGHYPEESNAAPVVGRGLVPSDELDSSGLVVGFDRY